MPRFNLHIWAMFARVKEHAIVLTPTINHILCELFLHSKRGVNCVSNLLGHPWRCHNYKVVLNLNSTLRERENFLNSTDNFKREEINCWNKCSALDLAASVFSTDVKNKKFSAKSTKTVKANESSLPTGLAIYNKMCIQSNASFSPEIPRRPLNSFANAPPGLIPPLVRFSLKSRPHAECKNANAE